MIEDFLNKKPELIQLKKINQSIEYWKINKKDFNQISKSYNVSIVKELSDKKSGIYVYQVNNYVIVNESVFYSLFKSIKDVKLINSQNVNHDYDPLQDFNVLGKDFLKITDIKNEDLKRLTRLNLDFSINSLDDLDVYIDSQKDKDEFIAKNKLLLISYLGNVIIKNSKLELSWSVLKLENTDYWEAKLINSDKEYEIDITKWFLSYIYEEESRIMGLRGLYSVLY